VTTSEQAVLRPKTEPGRAEFIALVAILMSIIALSVDIMLPGFGDISDHFQLAEDNDRQAIITVIFAGLMVGQLIFGPLSDYIGRKPSIIMGLGIHILGSILCIIAQDFMILLLGRFLQGFGGAAPRIVIVAMVRDRFEGQDMAKIMSIALTVFILVPTFAPAIGQVILMFAPWQALFAALLVMALIGGTWLTVRQPETHTEPAPFQAGKLINAVKTVFTTPVSLLYSMAAGCAFGTLLGYIVSSQQILQDLYGTGDLFAVYFGATAAFIALSNTSNAWLLGRYTMEMITASAIGTQVIWSLGFLVWLLITGTNPSLMVWMVFISVALFLVGITFGNYNAIALRPLGAIAGIASSITASIQTLISVLVAAAIGAAFDMNVMPVVLGSVLMGFFASALMVLARYFAKGQAALADPATSKSSGT
jgi:DHA1 family bicyclomycin/chloramphenicol resistance-like MFS transporter